MVSVEGLLTRGAFPLLSSFSEMLKRVPTLKTAMNTALHLHFYAFTENRNNSFCRDAA